VSRRPNKNPILDAMRDDDIAHDPWGVAMAWGFACADLLHVMGEDVPAEVQYTPALGLDFNVFPESTEDHRLWEMAQREIVGVEDVQFALRCLNRYIDWCKAAGRSY
jgi:hypothetical protein